ncbi:hypothetical protein [Enterocloster bolteae]|uniref:hypothetical protein n=1 Tax=Enterocloster bolteae TaxID=208479 RepID=UPI001FAE6577|nr:hypothetical protein [Enterocloster bolteae]
MANEHAIQATGTFVVSKGFRLLTKLAASQGSLQFTRAAVGTGKPPEGYSPESMIGLNAYKIDAEIADYGVQDDMAYITVQVSSDNVTEGFLVTEVGVFAEDPDEGEILYGYMDISTDPTYIYANGSTNRSKFAEFTLYVLIGSVSNVIAAVTPGSIITRDTFTAANLKAIDTHGILGGEAGAGTTGQGLIDALTNKLLTEFVTNTGLMERLGTYVLKSKIVNDFLSTDEETVLSGPMGKLLKEQLNVLNTKITNNGIVDSYSGDAVINLDWVRAGTVVYKVLNGTCFVDFDITVKAITAVNTLIVSGLPASTIVRHGRIAGWENGNISMPFYLNNTDIIANPCSAGRYAGCFSFSII